MIRKLFFSIVAVILFCGKTQGQIDHSVYSSTGGYNIKSAVTVSNERDKKHYLVGIDDRPYLFVTPLDNTIPHPLPDNANSRAFFTNIDNAFLRGGFFDSKGNIVVYGQCSSNGIICSMVIKITMNNAVASVMTYSSYLIPSNNFNQFSPVIVDGCWSWNAANNIMLYNFVTANGCFFRIKDDLNSYNQQILEFMEGRICAVSWDAKNKVYVLSGSNTFVNHNYNIVGYIPDAATLDVNSAHLTAFTPQNFTFSEGTNDHVLLDNDEVYLIQDFRLINTVNSRDGLWLMRFNYMTGQISFKQWYQFRPEKISIIDAAKSDKRLFVLGFHDGDLSDDPVVTFHRRYIMQFDLNNPMRYVAQWMDDMDLISNSCGTGFDILFHKYLSNIRFDHYSKSVYASGAACNDAYLVELFNMENTSCDTKIPITLPNFSFEQSETALIENIYVFPEPELLYPTSYNLNRKPLCADMTYTPSPPPVSGDWNNTYENYSHKLSPEIGEIHISNDGMFTCSGFAGSINYRIIDMAGRTVEDGATNNGATNFTKLKAAGMYILQTIDENQQPVNTKFVISK